MYFKEAAILGACAAKLYGEMLHIFLINLLRGKKPIIKFIFIDKWTAVFCLES